MSAPQLSFVTVCHGRLDHLRETLGSRLSQAACETIVVDYGCPQRAGDRVEATFPAARVTRVPATRFSGPDARNHGISCARAPWIALIDADVSLSASFAARVLPQLVPGHYYQFAPSTQETYGSFICAVTDLRAVDCYDAAIEGWGAADSDLFYRLRRAGCMRQPLPADLIDVISHDDTLRFANYDIKDKATSQIVNASYCHVKYQMEIDLGRRTSIDERRTLYAQVRSVLLPALCRGETPAVLTIHLPQVHHIGMPAGVLLKRTLVYELHNHGDGKAYPAIVV